jgi:hypothetical protein
LRGTLIFGNIAKCTLNMGKSCVDDVMIKKQKDVMRRLSVMGLNFPVGLRLALATTLGSKVLQLLEESLIPGLRAPEGFL